MTAHEPTAATADGAGMTAALDEALARVLRGARLARGLSTAALAAASGVSRASIVKVERADSQPSAALLARLCPPLGLTLSELFARVEGPGTAADRVSRAQDQPVWTDPGTGYVRRNLSPRSASTLELTEILLPAGAQATYPAQAYADLHQQLWVLKGTLRLREGAQVHDLGAGDCIELGPAAECSFANPGRAASRYLVAVSRRRP
nr:XRE family transcriptional regulator [Kineococcus rubinsiae]